MHLISYIMLFYLYTCIPWGSYIHFYYATFTDVVCDSLVCDVAGERCENDVCKCGTENSCAGNPSGEYCDATNNVCKCAEGGRSCVEEVGGC